MTSKASGALLWIALFAAILIPFTIWGDTFEAYGASLLDRATPSATLALIVRCPSWRRRVLSSSWLQWPASGFPGWPCCSLFDSVAGREDFSRPRHSPDRAPWSPDGPGLQRFETSSAISTSSATTPPTTSAILAHDRGALPRTQLGSCPWTTAR